MHNLLKFPFGQDLRDSYNRCQIDFPQPLCSELGIRERRRGQKLVQVVSISNGCLSRQILRGFVHKHLKS